MTAHQTLFKKYEEAKAEVERIALMPVGDEKFLRAVAKRDAMLYAAMLVVEESR